MKSIFEGPEYIQRAMYVVRDRKGLGALTVTSNQLMRQALYLHKLQRNHTAFFTTSPWVGVLYVHLQEETGSVRKASTPQGLPRFH